MAWNLATRLSGFAARWTVFVVVVWGIILYFSARDYVQNRYVNVQQLAPGVYRPLDDRYHHGRHLVVGWPAAFVGIRREVEEVKKTAPLRIVHVKTSVVALVLDVLFVAAVLAAGILFVQLRRGPFVPIRAVLLIFCLLVIVSAALWGPHNFLDRIPVYAEDL